MQPLPRRATRDELRLGLVGPGRTRNGLGPFLARHLERAGARVIAVAGRSAERTQGAAEALARDLGHPVEAHADVGQLVRRGDLAGLVIAAPIEAHLPALRAALAAGLPTLCEKPLVDVTEHAAAMTVVRAFAAAGVPLLENCQWPWALASLRRAGVVAATAPRSFAMRLSPAGRGRTMLVDSLSHFVSLLQALGALRDGARLQACTFMATAAGAELTVDLVVAASGPPLSARLLLVQCPQQPRPAWLEFDGRRLERRLALPAYHWVFADGQSEHGIGDPQADLAYSFVEFLSHPSPDLVRRHAAAITQRAESFAEVVGAFDRWCAG